MLKQITSSIPLLLLIGCAFVETLFSCDQYDVDTGKQAEAIIRKHIIRFTEKYVSVYYKAYVSATEDMLVVEMGMDGDEPVEGVVKLSLPGEKERHLITRSIPPIV